MKNFREMLRGPFNRFHIIFIYITEILFPEFFILSKNQSSPVRLTSIARNENMIIFYIIKYNYAYNKLTNRIFM